MPRNRTVYSGCTDPTQATARLVIVLVNRIKERYWGQQFCQMERDISVRPLELVPNIPVRPCKPKWTVSFDVPASLYQPKFPEFWVEWKAPIICTVYVSDIMLLPWKLGCKNTTFLLISKA